MKCEEFIVKVEGLVASHEGFCTMYGVLTKGLFFVSNAYSLNSYVTKSNTTVSYAKDVLHMSGVHFEAMVYTHKEI